MGTVPGRPTKSFIKHSYAASLHLNPVELTPNELPSPFIMAAKSTNADNDVLNYSEAMSAPDRNDFITAMQVELKAHIDRVHWQRMPRSQMPSNIKKTIRMVWSFKRKRRPDGSLLKHKARLCVHGGMQEEGINYWQTYAPVVRMSTIRLLMSLSITQDLISRQIDFILAYPQAPAETTIYLELPPGYKDFLSPGENPKDFVLLLIKNVYGLKQGSRTWFHYLRDGLKQRGYQQSINDPCLFTNGKTVLVAFVDDLLVYGKDRNDINKLVQSLHEEFQLTDEGEDIHQYLGILITKSSTGIHLSQPFLIQRIIAAIGLTPTDTRTTRHTTPADTRAQLHADHDGPDRKQEWSYRSIIGMLTYLTGTTRPDIAYAVHQCARFSSKPKHLHETATKRIIRYLLSNQEQGIHYRADATKALECFIDTDFAKKLPPERPRPLILPLSLWLPHLLQQLPYHLGQQATNFNSSLQLRSRIHCTLHRPTRCDTTNEDPPAALNYLDPSFTNSFRHRS